MSWLNRLFIVLTTLTLSLLPSQAFSSEFDSTIDPCQEKESIEDLRKRGNVLLEGLNFLKIGSNYHLNCAKRLYALLVIREQTESWETTFNALDTIGWQSTFSDQAAQTLMDFIDTNPNNPLKRKAAWAFYFLLEGFPKIEVQNHFFSQKSFLLFYQNFLNSDTSGAAYYLAQVAQKTAGYFLQPPVADMRHCYRDNLSNEKHVAGENLAKLFAPLLVNALFQRLDNSPTNESVRNEIFVALRNFSYSQFLKNNKDLVEKIRLYKSAAPTNHDVLLADDVLEALSVPCLSSSR
ncbi:MAG: hypothetical protein SGJ18_02145 [Pseudomonadota bacterium]|nr:hypothetical protein [Pseudomonadota bacterium]